ncbi:hypothetical protein [Pseudalkalibacillus caeni]|uniref:hypothetical protein n=1 Tax=Exobacillus caeni TaxID=2574798 RepID=UPI0014856DF9|nr:hypothetical protein [Pseudalkalibacillus caeni]
MYSHFHRSMSAAEALPAKLELPGVEINAAIASQFFSNVKLIKQQKMRKEPKENH